MTSQTYVGVLGVHQSKKSGPAVFFSSSPASLPSFAASAALKSPTRLTWYICTPHRGRPEHACSARAVLVRHAMQPTPRAGQSTLGHGTDNRAHKGHGYGTDHTLPGRAHLAAVGARHQALEVQLAVLALVCVPRNGGAAAAVQRRQEGTLAHHSHARLLVVQARQVPAGCGAARPVGGGDERGVEVGGWGWALTTACSIRHARPPPARPPAVRPLTWLLPRPPCGRRCRWRPGSRRAASPRCSGSA